MHPIITEELEIPIVELRSEGDTLFIGVKKLDDVQEFMVVRADFLSRVLSKLVAEVEVAIPDNDLAEASDVDPGTAKWWMGWNSGRQATLDALRSVIGKE